MRARQLGVIPATVFLCLFVWTVRKAFVFGIHYQDEAYFWLNDYGHGFARRALIGTILSPIVMRAGLAAVVFCAHFLALAAVFLAARAVLERAAGRAGPIQVGLAGALFATSPFLAHLAHLVGYPDGLITVLLCVCALQMRHWSAAVVTGVLILACLVHELAFLLLLPMAVFAACIDPLPGMWRRLAWLAAGTAVAVPLILFTNGAAPDLVTKMVAAGFDPTVATAQIQLSLQQGVANSFHTQLASWHAFGLDSALAVLYSALPGLLILLLFAPQIGAEITSRSQDVWARLALVVLCLGSGFAGLAVLAIAFDLSRIASFTTLTCFLTVGALLRDGAVRSSGRGLWPICGAAVAFYALLPLCMLHFGSGQIINAAFVRRLCPPCTALGIKAIDAYNYAEPADIRRRADENPIFGNE